MGSAGSGCSVPSNEAEEGLKRGVEDPMTTTKTRRLYREGDANGKMVGRRREEAVSQGMLRYEASNREKTRAVPSSSAWLWRRRSGRSSPRAERLVFPSNRIGVNVGGHSLLYR